MRGDVLQETNLRHGLYKACICNEYIKNHFSTAKGYLDEELACLPTEQGLATAAQTNTQLCRRKVLYGLLQVGLKEQFEKEKEVDF